MDKRMVALWDDLTDQEKASMKGLLAASCWARQATLAPCERACPARPIRYRIFSAIVKVTGSRSDMA